ncbi:hypothetical protein CRG98_009571 [Punica granatum]|uniref:Uncharacterized protein n=1 Tax=Punica granatum TaxID=22663 RepID=A0A2I0KNQ4_PUNGR|nr:hypothetical protein CRG98_009571 [Punica granatum]
MRCDQRPSPSRPPIPHDRRVVPTIADFLIELAFIASGFGLASGSGPPFTALGFGSTSASGPALGSGPAFTVLGFGLASGFGPASSSDPAFTASGSGPAFIVLGFGPTSGSGPASGSIPAFTTSGFGPASAFGPTFGLRPLIGLRPYFWTSAPHRASVLHLLLSGTGPAFTAFGLWPYIYCFWAPAQHLLLSGFDTPHLLLSSSSEIQNQL